MPHRLPYLRYRSWVGNIFMNGFSNVLLSSTFTQKSGPGMNVHLRIGRTCSVHLAQRQSYPPASLSGGPFMPVPASNEESKVAVMARTSPMRTARQECTRFFHSPLYDRRKGQPDSLQRRTMLACLFNTRSSSIGLDLLAIEERP